MIQSSGGGNVSGTRTGGKGRSVCTHPSITLEWVDNSELRVSTEWPADADLALFGHILVYLCQGKLLGIIANAIMLHAQRIGESEKGESLASMLLDQVDAGGESADDPVVCPTNAVRMSMRAFGP